MLQIGAQAPNFRIRLNDGTLFSLSEVVGQKPIILSFFPADLKQQVQHEIYFLLQNLQKAKTLGTFVLAISPKGIIELKRVLDLYDFDIPIAEDKDLDICRNYRTIWLRGLGARRITYVIDLQGIIRGRIAQEFTTPKQWETIFEILKKIEAHISEK